MKRQWTRNFLMAGSLLDRKSYSSPIIDPRGKGSKWLRDAKRGERAAIHSRHHKESDAFRRNQ